MLLVRVISPLPLTVSVLSCVPEVEPLVSALAIITLLPSRLRLVSVGSQVNAPVVKSPALTLPTFTVGAFTASMMACVICNVPAPPEKPTLVLAVRGAKVTVPVVWAEKLASERVSALKVILPVSDPPPIKLGPAAMKIP